jgi:hypothetical protein
MIASILPHQPTMNSAEEYNQNAARKLTAEDPCGAVLGLVRDMRLSPGLMGFKSALTRGMEENEQPIR